MIAEQVRATGRAEPAVIAGGAVVGASLFVLATFGGSMPSWVLVAALVVWSLGFVLVVLATFVRGVLLALWREQRRRSAWLFAGWVALLAAWWLFGASLRPT